MHRRTSCDDVLLGAARGRRSPRSRVVAQLVGLRPGDHRAQHHHGHLQAVPARDRAAAAQRSSGAMARRLSAFADLRQLRPAGRAALADARRATSSTRTAYNAALIFGDPRGAAYLAVSQPVLQTPGRCSVGSTPAAQRAMASAAGDPEPGRCRGHRRRPTTRVSCA